jgi:hypothetical protein
MDVRLSRFRGLIAAGLVLIAVGVSACGSGSSSPSSSSSSSATQSSGGGASSSTTSGGIPQGPNAGDKDADNNGAPSDGDGNM